MRLAPVACALAFVGLACQRPGAAAIDGGSDGCSVDCCQRLADCDGGVGAAICDGWSCDGAGGPSAPALVRAVLPLAFASSPSALLTVSVLADVRPDGGPLDCAAIANGVDAGSLSPADDRAVNPLLAPYAVPAHLSPGKQLLEFGLDRLPSGPDRLVVLAGSVGGADAGPLAAFGCVATDLLADGGTVVGAQVEAW